MNRVSGCSRRHFLYAAPLTLLLAGCRRNNWFDAQKTTPLQNSNPTTALSLAVLQERLKRNQDRSNAQVPLLIGINRITGFLVDGFDVILFGHRDKALPEIDLDSFVVALRNAFGSGGEYQGAPGCSIDPIPGDDPYRVQKVSVFGIPHDCLMAARYVSLDYELKRSGAGIPGNDGKILPSAFELADQGGPCATSGDRSITLIHRYWFFPKTPAGPRFERDHQTASILRPIGVQLLTEQEFQNRRGERIGATEANPMARQFAGAVTSLLESNKVVRYSQMVLDFRIIEVAKLMHYCGIPKEAISFLLRDYKPAHIDVPVLIGGVQREEQSTTVCRTTVTQTAAAIRYSESASQYRYEYRGGVEAKVEVSDLDVVSTSLARLRRLVLDARPSLEALSWEIS